MTVLNPESRREAFPRPPLYGDDQLQTLQRNAFRYFLAGNQPVEWAIPDNTSADGIPASIARVGLALSTPVAVERSSVTRAQAVERTLATLRFLWNAKQGPMPDATRVPGILLPFPRCHHRPARVAF